MKRKIGLTTATAMVAANMIGTGVFTSLGFQVTSISSGFAIVALWLVGGLVAMCGALVYGELGAAMPRSGGEYHLLSRIYHPFVGFLSGWVSVLVGFAAPVAAASMAMGMYGTRVLQDITGLPAGDGSWMVKLLAIGVTTAVAVVNFGKLESISRFQVFFTGLKIVLIVVLVFCGFLLAEPRDISFAPSMDAVKTLFSAPFAVSLIFVMYAYSGWNASVYIIDEIDKPQRTLPWSLIIGTAVVILLYVPVNMAFLNAAPIDAMQGKEEVGYVAAGYIFGKAGGVVMGLLISIGLISAINSMTWAGPRVMQVIGEDMPLFGFLKRKNRNGVPSTAVMAQLVIVQVLILTATFEAIIFYIGFILSLSSFLAVLGVFVLRRRFPELRGSYRTWGYPVTPLIYLGVTSWMLYFVVRERPMESLAGVATLAVGAAVYFIGNTSRKTLHATLGAADLVGFQVQEAVTTRQASPQYDARVSRHDYYD
ncbi:MAG: amino acid permease [bacterium]|nr:amino acid permease [bacterium]